MGKKDFKKLYRAAVENNGADTCKSSYFCDDYDPKEDYAGLICYAINGKFNWTNVAGMTKNYRGRSFYLIILKTSAWPPDAFEDANQGRVHNYLLQHTFGQDYSRNNVMCSGFAISKNSVDSGTSSAKPTLRYSSVWLNASTQKGIGGDTDGSKYLSEYEKELVRYMVDHWKRNGKHKIYAFPESLKRKLK